VFSLLHLSLQPAEETLEEAVVVEAVAVVAGVSTAKAAETPTTVASIFEGESFRMKFDPCLSVERELRGAPPVIRAPRRMLNTGGIAVVCPQQVVDRTPCPGGAARYL
jgi:hypothetical protein